MLTTLFHCATRCLAIAAAGLVAVSDAGAADHSVCAEAVARAEIAHNLPSRLLTAVALTESSRWLAGQQRSVAWPWTVTADGEGRYFASKRAAIRAVEQLRRRGVRSIDVGCLQINLRHHPGAFDDLDTAFDPNGNADYAARFLRRLQRDTSDWCQAVARYHSATPALGQPYQRKVFARLEPPQRATPAPTSPANAAVDDYRNGKIAAYLEARAVRRARGAGGG